MQFQSSHSQRNAWSVCMKEKELLYSFPDSFLTQISYNCDFELLYTSYSSIYVRTVVTKAKLHSKSASNGIRSPWKNFSVQTGCVSSWILLSIIFWSGNVVWLKLANYTHPTSFVDCIFETCCAISGPLLHLQRIRFIWRYFNKRKKQDRLMQCNKTIVQCY